MGGKFIWLIAPMFMVFSSFQVLHAQEKAVGRKIYLLSDKHLFDIISKGGSAVDKSPFMPAWGSQLKEKQIREIIAHIRSLAVPPYRPSGK